MLSYMQIYLILIISPWNKHYHESHFSDEKIDAQKLAQNHTVSVEVRIWTQEVWLQNYALNTTSTDLLHAINEAANFSYIYNKMAVLGTLFNL